jgi:hypothetical protein
MACVYGPLQDVDEHTMDLVVQLQLADAELYDASCKGKGREGDLSDESLAFQLQRQELEGFSLFRTDNAMAQSIASAVQADGHVLTEIQSEEDTALRDHGIASRLNSGVEGSEQQNKANDEAESVDDELLEKLRVLYVSGLENAMQHQDIKPAGLADREQVESSAWGAGRANNTSSIERRCEACREEGKFFDIARLPCCHEYCRDSLRALFEAAMTDESLFPPRCCRQPIKINSVRIFLIAELVRGYWEKKIEFETPNRTYCHSSKCSAFISLDHIEDEVGTCPNCYLTTCTTGKGSAHAADCPDDSLLQQVLDLAQQNEWQRCYNCSRVVELDHGCNHITFVASHISPAAMSLY